MKNYKLAILTFFMILVLAMFAIKKITYPFQTPRVYKISMKNYV